MGTVRLFTDGWEFAKTPLGTEMDSIDAGQYVFEPVELPHDWLIRDSRNLYENSCGWYRKELVLAEPVPEKVILRFDGVYMDSTLYANGRKVGDWKYGYSTFEMDITDHLHAGGNRILLQVRFQSPNSRWYSGAGIYRRVWLQMCGEAFLPVDGCRVETTACEDGFWLDVSTEVECCADDLSVDGEVECRYFLYRDNALAQELGGQQWRRTADAEETESVFLARQGGGGGRILLMGARAKIPAPALWDLESPACYTLGVELWRGDVQLDGQRITIVVEKTLQSYLGRSLTLLGT